MKTDIEEIFLERKYVERFSPKDSVKWDLKTFDPKITRILAERRAEFLRYLQSRLRDRDEAEDVLQDFCMKVLAKAGQIRDEKSTGAWLRTVLKSVLADHFRRKATERNGYEKMVTEWRATHDEVETPVADGIDIDHTACACLYKILPTLKSEYADVLSRVDLAQQSRADVALALGTTPGNIRVRLHRARLALKKSLEYSCKHCPVHGEFEEGKVYPSNGGQCFRSAPSP